MKLLSRLTTRFGAIKIKGRRRRARRVRARYCRSAECFEPRILLTTNVSLARGVLTIEDIDTPSDDSLGIQIDNFEDVLLVRDARQPIITAIRGASGSGKNEVRIPLRSLGAFTIDVSTGSGNDSVRVGSFDRPGISLSIDTGDGEDSVAITSQVQTSGLFVNAERVSLSAPVDAGSEAIILHATDQLAFTSDASLEAADLAISAAGIQLDPGMTYVSVGVDRLAAQLGGDLRILEKNSLEIATIAGIDGVKAAGDVLIQAREELHVNAPVIAAGKLALTGPRKLEITADVTGASVDFADSGEVHLAGSVTSTARDVTLDHGIRQVQLNGDVSIRSAGNVNVATLVDAGAVDLDVRAGGNIELQTVQLSRGNHSFQVGEGAGRDHALTFLGSAQLGTATFRGANGSDVLKLYGSLTTAGSLTIEDFRGGVWLEPRVDISAGGELVADSNIGVINFGGRDAESHSLTSVGNMYLAPLADDDRNPRLLLTATGGGLSLLGTYQDDALGRAAHKFTSSDIRIGGSFNVEGDLILLTDSPETTVGIGYDAIGTYQLGPSDIAAIARANVRPRTLQIGLNDAIGHVDIRPSDIDGSQASFNTNTSIVGGSISVVGLGGGESINLRANRGEILSGHRFVPGVDADVQGSTVVLATLNGEVGERGLPIRVEAEWVKVGTDNHDQFLRAIQPTQVRIEAGLGTASLEGQFFVPADSRIGAANIELNGAFLSGERFDDTPMLFGDLTMTEAGGLLAAGPSQQSPIIVDGDVMLDDAGEIVFDLSDGGGGTTLLVTGESRRVDLAGVQFSARMDELRLTEPAEFVVLELADPSSELIGKFSIKDVNGGLEELPEGASGKLNDQLLFLTYAGGDGNDVVLRTADLSLKIDGDSVSENAGKSAVMATVSRPTGGPTYRDRMVPSEPLIVTISTSDDSELTPPRTVTIPAGERSVTFPLHPVDDDVLDGFQTVAVTVGHPDYFAAKASVTVLDAESLSLSFQDVQISEDAGGSATFLEVSRSNTDVDEPLLVDLSFDDATEIRLPSVVTIPAGQQSVIVPVDAVDDEVLDGAQTVFVKAIADGYAGAKQSLDVVDAEFLSLEFDTDVIVEDAGKSAASLTLSRSNTDIDEPILVTLSLDDASEISVPNVVSIPAGQQSVTVPVAAVDDQLLDGTQTVFVSATADGYVAAMDSIDVVDAEFLSLKFDTDVIAEDVGKFAASLKLSRSNTDDDEPLFVTLSLDDDTEISVPNVVTIPAGQQSVIVPVDAVDDQLLDGRQTVFVSATADGYTDATDSIEVADAEFLSLKFDTDVIAEDAGQAAVAVTITRSNTNIDEALFVALSLDDASEISLPNVVSIPAGQQTVTVLVDAVDDQLLDGTQSVFVIATAAGYAPGADSIDVADAEFLSLQFDTDIVVEDAGQAAALLTVRRSNTDVDEPLVVNLFVSPESEIEMPASVTIPAGSRFVDVSIAAVDDHWPDGDVRVELQAIADRYASGDASLLVEDVGFRHVPIGPESPPNIAITPPIPSPPPTVEPPKLMGPILTVPVPPAVSTTFEIVVQSPEVEVTDVVAAETTSDEIPIFYITLDPDDEQSPDAPVIDEHDVDVAFLPSHFANEPDYIDSVFPRLDVASPETAPAPMQVTSEAANESEPPWDIRTFWIDFVRQLTNALTLRGVPLHFPRLNFANTAQTPVAPPVSKNSESRTDVETSNRSLLADDKGKEAIGKSSTTGAQKSGGETGTASTDHSIAATTDASGEAGSKTTGENDSGDSTGDRGAPGDGEVTVSQEMKHLVAASVLAGTTVVLAQSFTSVLPLEAVLHSTFGTQLAAVVPRVIQGTASVANALLRVTGLGNLAAAIDGFLKKRRRRKAEQRHASRRSIALEMQVATSASK